jgi:hypothetical protein
LPVADAYEDWYLVEGSFALDPLNEVAVSPALGPPHDQAARGASGAGGLYRLRSGLPAPRDGVVHWLSKARTDTRTSARASRPTRCSGAGRWWLGPAPEFLLEWDRAPEGVDAVAAARTLVIG